MSHTPDFQQRLTPRSLTFCEVADNFPLVQGDPGPVNFATGAWLPELPPTPDASALVGTPPTPGPLYLPDEMPAADGGYNEPFNFDDTTTGNADIPPYEYYGLDVDIPTSASTSTTSAQPLTTTIANSQSDIEIVEDTTKKPSKAAKGKAKGKARGAAAGAGDGDEGRLWTEDDYVWVARACCEVAPWLFPFGKKDDGWLAVVDHLKTKKFRRAVSVATLKIKIAALLKYHEGTNPTLIKAGGSAAIALGGLLESCAQMKKNSRGKSNSEKAVLKKKHDEDRATGVFIRQQSMKGLRGRHDAPTRKLVAAETPKPTNIVSIAPHLRTLTADQEAELVADGLGPVPTLASASVARAPMSATPIDENPFLAAPFTQSTRAASPISVASSPLAIDTTTPDPLPLTTAAPRPQGKEVDVDVMTPTPPVPATSASVKTPDVAMVESDDSEDEKENKLPLKRTASKVDWDSEDEGSAKKARKTKRRKARRSTGSISNDDIYAHMIKESERREEQFKAMMQSRADFMGLLREKL